VRPRTERRVFIDPATALALERLALSRERVAGWIDARLHPQPQAEAGFHPRSALLNALLFLGRQRFPWLRWAVSAFMMLRAMRRRRR